MHNDRESVEQRTLYRLCIRTTTSLIVNSHIALLEYIHKVSHEREVEMQHCTDLFISTFDLL
jgi:hypothetical protein